MPQGLQVWDASGNSILDTSMRLGRVLGVRTLTGGTNSSHVDAGLSTGTPFWIVTSLTAPNIKQPDVSVAGTTISWTWAAGSSGDWRLVYGVY